MDAGIGGEAEILYVTDKDVVYKYYSYNKNDAVHINEGKIADGLIDFKRSCFKKTDIINYLPYIRKGLIKIENTFNCWNESVDGYDSMALRFINELLHVYRTEKTVPNKIEIHY